MSSVEVWLYASDNSTLVAMLEQAYDVRYGDVLSGLGSGSFAIPLPDPNLAAVAMAADDDDSILADGGSILVRDGAGHSTKASLITGGQIARLRIDNEWVGAFVVEQLDVPDALVQRVLTVSGRTLLSLYERAIVYPSDTADWSTTQKPYLTKTFAYIIDDLVTAAGVRGVTLPTDDFSPTVDSDGQAWTDSNTVQYRASMTLLEVIRHHAEMGIEVTMGPTGVLHYYKAGGAGQNRSSTVRFREGLNVRAAGRKADYAGIANAVLGEGQYIMSLQTDATSIAAYGRRERVAQHGNVSNSTTLATLTQQSRDSWKNPVTSIVLSVADANLTPFVDYGLGDTVTVVLPTDGLSTTYRIRGIALASEGTDTQVQLTLNSLADEYLLQMDQALRRKLLSPIEAVISPNTDPNIGGWLLSTTQLSAVSGAAILHSTGYLQLGTGNDLFRADAADATYRVWIGNATAGSAPFRVTKAGALTATGATISGSITSTSGTIADWTIGATTLSKNNATLDSGGALTLGTGNDIVKLSSVDATYRLWIGNATAASAPFRVTKAGSVTATSGTIGGWTLGATSLTGGDATLASSGNLTLGTTNDVVRLSSDDATYRLWIGHATAASAPFRVTKAGYVTATSGNVGGFTLSGSALYNGDFKLDATNKRIYFDSGAYAYWASSAIQFVGVVNFDNDVIIDATAALDNFGNTILRGSLRVDSNLGFFGTTAIAQKTGYSVSNVTTDRTYDANSTTLDEVADVLGTLIADLKAYGLIGA